MMALAVMSLAVMSLAVMALAVMALVVMALAVMALAVTHALGIARGGLAPRMLGALGAARGRLGRRVWARTVWARTAQAAMQATLRVTLRERLVWPRARVRDMPARLCRACVVRRRRLAACNARDGGRLRPAVRQIARGCARSRPDCGRLHPAVRGLGLGWRR